MPPKATYNDYMMLLRWHRLVGAWLLFWPCAWGILCATPTRDSMVWFYLALHAVGAIFLRSAGCVINDIFDRKLDAQVERTKNRPLARGVISVRAACIVLCLLLLAGLAIAWALPWRTLGIALLAMPLVVLYPLAKRYIKAPQVVLGIVFAWGAWTGASVVAPHSYIYGLWPYLAAVFCTIGYDTIYALHDAPDDAAQGMNSTPLWWGTYSIYGIALCYSITSALWAVMGTLYAPHNIWFWLCWCMATGILAHSVYALPRADALYCDTLFKRAHYSMGIIALGLL